MALEKTLCIIKPNAVNDNNIGKILAHYEAEGLYLIGCKLVRLSKEKAEGFYIEHKEKNFFNSLISFMTSGPVMLVVLEGDEAVSRNRELMGSTNPSEAAPGTIRKLYARSMEANAVHGSDSSTSAQREISYFFDTNELCFRNSK